MKLRHDDIVIPVDGTDPFVNCQLDRKKYADILTSIVDSYADGFVLAINNPWGEGKTTFVKMWRQQMINAGFQTLYYNAWENDFESDVLIALISELSELKNKPEEKFKDVLKKVVPLTSSLLPSLSKHLAKKLVGDEVVEDFVEAIGQYTEEQLKEATKKYNSRKKSIIEFKDSLELFVKEAGNGKPVIFMIDELDRCRPSYAVEVLEQIKHLFSVPGIVFVLSIDKIQLGYAVRGVYGNDNIDSDEYLRRFIDLEYAIPKPSIKEYISYLFSYFKFNEFYDDIRLNSRFFRYEKENLTSVYLVLFSSKLTTLRGHVKLLSRLRLILKTFKEDQFSLPEVVVFLLYLKTYHPSIYNDISNKTYGPQELLDKLNELFQNIKEDKEKNVIAITVAKLIVFYCNFIERSGARNYISYDKEINNQIVNLNFALNQEEFATSFIFLRNDFNIDSLSLDWLITRIELTEKIVS